MIIYKITNKQNNLIYIGQTSRTLEKRWQQHVWTASKHKDNYALYNAIRKYGAESFTVEQIDVAFTKGEMDEKEKYWIAFYNCKAPNGYNLTNGGEGVVGNKISEESRQKLIASHLGKTPWNRGKKMPSKIIDNNRKASIKMWQREGYINHTNKGQKIHTAKHIEILAEQWRGAKNPRAKQVKCVENNTIYQTVNDAARATGVSRPNISQCLIGNNKTAGGLHFEYAEVR